MSDHHSSSPAAPAARRTAHHGLRVWACLVFLWMPVAASAQGPMAHDQGGLPPLKQLTLEELMAIDVTLPLRTSEPVQRAPAAISVLTAEDIRRLGPATLPEALRFVPGLFVARHVSTSSPYVISARGFAQSSPNKLQVMMDGRSLYSPLFSAVFWEQHDTLLPDLDRIEVIRGPGAALWGSNAVNGVINVVSKPAAATQGTLVTVGGGAEERLFGAVRYGGRAGAAGHFRIYGKALDRDENVLAAGGPAGDRQRAGLGGFRVDLGAGRDRVTLQGEAIVSRRGLLGRADIESDGAHVLARWTRQLARDGEVTLLAYYDRTHRLVPGSFEETRGTYDVDFQHRWRPMGRHLLTWGGAYRVSRDDTTPSHAVRFVPEDRTTDLASVFVQDDITILPEVSITVGSKFERNDYTGLEIQPTLRGRWTVRPRQMVWGAVSRAVRLPTRLETDIEVLAGGHVVISGNDRFDSESVVAYEAGYRVQPAPSVSIDVAAFRNVYDRLRTSQPGMPAMVANGLNARATGLELVAAVQPAPWVRVTGTYSYLRNRTFQDATSHDPVAEWREANDPTHQAQAFVRLDLPRGFELDGTARRVSALPAPGTPAYSEATLRFGWRPRPDLEVSLVGRDLLHARHVEFTPVNPVARAAIQRAVYLRVTTAF